MDNDQAEKALRGLQVISESDKTPALARRMVVGWELSRQRTAASVTVGQAARTIKGHPSKISRMESGRSGFKAQDLDLLMDLYAVGADERHRLLTDAATANRRGWWASYRSLVLPHMRSYYSLEDLSHRVENWEQGVLCGLLQTEDYTRELMLPRYPEPTPRVLKEVDRLVELRQQRQKAFDRAQKTLWNVVDETALLHWRKRPEILLPQLKRLVELADDPRYTLLMLEFDQWQRPEMPSSLTLFRFTDERLQSVAFLERPNEGTLQTDPREAEELAKAFHRLSYHSLDREQTRQRLASLVKEFE